MPKAAKNLNYCQLQGEVSQKKEFNKIYFYGEILIRTKPKSLLQILSKLTLYHKITFKSSVDADDTSREVLSIKDLTHTKAFDANNHFSKTLIDFNNKSQEKTSSSMIQSFFNCYLH